MTCWFRCGMMSKMASEAWYDRVWRSRTHLLERRGQRLRVIAVGALNTALVEFEDGVKHVVSSFGYGRLPASDR